jgi:hypothetical protein
MYILTNAELTKGTSGGSSSSCGAGTPDQYEDLQRTIRTRVEEALGVETLNRVECRDTFQITGSDTRECLLRTANAFLTLDTPVFLDSEGEVLEITPSLVDRKYGVITVTLDPGTYTVEYTSGFEAEPGSNVYKFLPDWMKSIALTIAFLWRRSMNVAAADKTSSHYDLNTSIVRELNARIFNRYDRPRAMHEFHMTHQRRVITEDDSGEWNEW